MLQKTPIFAMRFFSGVAESFSHIAEERLNSFISLMDYQVASVLDFRFKDLKMARFKTKKKRNL